MVPCYNDQARYSLVTANLDPHPTQSIERQDNWYVYLFLNTELTQRPVLPIDHTKTEQVKYIRLVDLLMNEKIPQIFLE